MILLCWGVADLCLSVVCVLWLVGFGGLLVIGLWDIVLRFVLECCIVFNVVGWVLILSLVTFALSVQLHGVG